MSGRLVETRKIKADAFTLFDCIRDDVKMRDWTPEIEDIHWMPSPNPARECGARAAVVMRDGDEQVNWLLTVTQCQAPDNVEQVWQRAGLTLTLRYDLAEMSGGYTRLTVTFEPQGMDLQHRLGMILGGTRNWRKMLTDRVKRLAKLAEHTAQDAVLAEAASKRKAKPLTLEDVTAAMVG